MDALFERAQAIVVVLSPEEHVSLREDLRTSDRTDAESWQPRPNVFLEAGMALAKDREHTIIIQIGRVREASDLFGRNVIRLDNSPEQRHSFVQRLTSANCDASTKGTDWLHVGQFEVRDEKSKVSRKGIA